MKGWFTVEAEPARDLIRIAMGGFFTPEDIARFEEARRAAHAKLTCGRNRHLTLNDLREMKIQSQEAVTAFHSILAAREYHSRRLAFVVSPTLARGQVKRALSDRDARFFDDVASAEAWLLAA